MLEDGNGVGRRKVLVRLAAGFGMATATAAGGWVLYEQRAGAPSGTEGAFLRAYATQGDLVAQLRSTLGLGAAADLGTAAARQALVRACRADLASDRTVRVHGWVLAQAEVDYCAWRALADVGSGDGVGADAY